MRAPCLFLVLALLLAAGCGGEEEATPERSRFAAAAQTAVRVAEASDAIVLDVRSEEEVAQGRAAGSVHFPLTELEDGLLPDIPKDARVFVYCRTGRRAEIAARILRREGWSDVTNIGGLDDWRGAGGDVVS